MSLAKQPREICAFERTFVKELRLNYKAYNEYSMSWKNGRGVFKLINDDSALTYSTNNQFKFLKVLFLQWWYS